MYIDCVYLSRKYSRAYRNYKRGDRGAQCSVQDIDSSTKDKQDAKLNKADQTRECRMLLKERGLKEQDYINRKGRKYSI